MTTLQPLHDKIVVETEQNDSVTQSGIVIPDAAADTPTVGRVIATGPGGYDERGGFKPVTLRTGDRILFTRVAGQRLKVGDEEFHIMREEEIIARINPVE